MSAPTEKDLLARARAGMTPSPADKARMRQRLVAAVGAASVAGASASASAATAGTSAIGATSLPFKLVFLLAGASLLGGVGYWMSDAESERPIERLEVAAPAPAPVPTSARPVPPRAPMAIPPEAANADEPSAITDEPVPAGHPPSLRTRPSESPPALPVDTLAEETALIRRARASARSEDWTAALSALDEHGRRFPSGFLAEERDVQRVRVHCAVGDVATAEADARRFLRAHPGSLHAGAMADPCAEGH